MNIQIKYQNIGLGALFLVLRWNSSPYFWTPGDKLFYMVGSVLGGLTFAAVLVFGYTKIANKPLAREYFLRAVLLLASILTVFNLGTLRAFMSGSESTSSP